MSRQKDYTLIVGRSDLTADLEASLGTATPIFRCEGVASTKCPAVQGKRCPLRDGARFAVIFVGNDEIMSDNVECMAGSDAPAVSVILGSSLAPYASGGFAAVGDELGPLGVLEAVAGIIEEPVTG
jgi:hypothetical protein